MILDENGGGMSGNDLRTLIESRIPEHRAHLETSHLNLENVAAYCEANYLNAVDRNASFEETKQFALQSLASVAYQINTLARDLLDMLDLQTDKISNLSGQVENIDVVVNIHKEKLARREIGALTTNKTTQKQPKIIAPAAQEPPQRYRRAPIDFSVLDGIGHGVRCEVPQHRGGIVSRAASTVSGSQPYSMHYVQYERTANIGGNTLGRSSMRSGHLSMNTPDQYRVPLVMPLVDHQRYMSVGPISHHQPASEFAQLVGRETTDSSVLSDGASDLGRISMQDRYDLPPPVMQMLNSTHEDEPLPPPPQANFFDAHADWIPRNYIEKAVALYDYDADKPDELSLRENCIVYVLRKNDDGWYEGVLDGVTGLFPGNYVQPV
uniref:Abl-interactor and Src homology-3 domain containing protein n=1 Tax=Haemonchus contortus TaxID=6289 RepID=W6NEH2_HAECO